MTNKKAQLNFKIILIGDTEIGKTSLIQTFIKGKTLIQQPNVNVTVGVQFASKLIKVQDKVINLQIWDTSGQDVYQAITKNFYRGAAAVLLAYSIADKTTFGHLQNWLEQFKQNGSEDALIILVGTKNDLPRQVQPQQGFKYLKNIDGSIYFETSSVNGFNVDQLFIKTAQIMYKTYCVSKSFRRLVNPQINSTISLYESPNVSKTKKKKRDCC